MEVKLDIAEIQASFPVLPREDPRRIVRQVQVAVKVQVEFSVGLVDGEAERVFLICIPR